MPGLPQTCSWPSPAKVPPGCPGTLVRMSEIETRNISTTSIVTIIAIVRIMVYFIIVLRYPENSFPCSFSLSLYITLLYTP